MNDTQQQVIPAPVSADPLPWRLPWTQRGACLDSTLDPDAWFPVSSAPEASLAAKAVCDTCPVQMRCLAAAMRSTAIVGIWGGTDETERRLMLRRAARHA